MEPQPLYSVVLLLAAAIALVIAVVAWPRRTAPGAKPLISYLFAIEIWSVTYAIHWLSTEPAQRFFWLDATYLGVVFSAVTFLAFALEYTGRGHWLTRRKLAALCVVPILTLLALATDNMYGLFYGGQHPIGLIFSGGPAFWLNVVYGYTLQIIALVILIRAFRHAPLLQRRQASMVLIGALVPFAINILTFAGFRPFKDLDLTPLAFTITGIFSAIGLFRYGMFELVPIARGVLIEHLPDGMLVLDQQQRIIDLNPAATRLLDRTTSQLVGLTLPQIIEQWPHLPDQSTHPIELTLPVGRIVEGRLSTLRDQRGQRQGDVILLRDITDRKQAEAALQQLNASLETQVLARTADLRAEKDKSDTILQSVGDAILLADLDFRIQYVNEAFTTLTGYSTADALGLPIGARAAWPDASDVLTRLRTGAVWRGEVVGHRVDNRPYEAALTIAPVRDGRGQLIGCVISYQDITQRKSLDRARVRFMDSISHEFRTPLTSLSLYIELLQSGRRPDKTDHYLAQLTGQVQRLQRLIQDSLDMAALDVHPTLSERQLVDLAAMVRDTTAHFAAEAAAKDVTLEAVYGGDDLQVWGDETRLVQALGEVVENAVQYTLQGGHVTLSTSNETSHGVVWGVIAVRDTGPGLTPDELPRVFDRFYRGLQAESGHIPGSGLGLSITQAIVRAHGGDITAHSDAGHGCTFSLRLPTAR